MRLSPLVLIGLLAACTAVAQQAPATPATDPAAAAFRQGLQEAARQDQTKRDGIRKSYTAALNGLRSRLREAGDLDGLIAIDAALKAAEAEDWTPQPPAAGALTSLTDLHARCAQALARADAETAAARVQLHERYLQWLDGRIREHVRADRISEATQLREEANAIQFALAELKVATAPAPASPAPAGQAAPPVTPAGLPPAGHAAPPEPNPVAAVPAIVPAAAQPAASAPLARSILKIEFDGGDLPKYRKEGTGLFVERNGRLMVDSFGSNNRLADFYGMRLIAPLNHDGDFRLVAPFTLHSEGRPGLVRMTAHFSNRAEALVELLASSPYSAQLRFAFPGQPATTRAVYLTRGFVYYSTAPASYLSPENLPFVIERQGTTLSVSAGGVQLGSADLKATGTALTGVSIDIQRPRNKNQAVAEMWVESVELTAP